AASGSSASASASGAPEGAARRKAAREAVSPKRKHPCALHRVCIYTTCRGGALAACSAVKTNDPTTGRRSRLEVAPNKRRYKDPDLDRAVGQAMRAMRQA